MEERRGNWEGKVRKARRESRECVEFRQGMGRQEGAGQRTSWQDGKQCEGREMRR